MNKLMNLAGGALVASAFMLPLASPAALFLWDNDDGDGLFSKAANWNPDSVPGAADLALHNNGAAVADLTINGNWSVDSLRTGDGGNVNHTAGILTIANGSGPDNGLWVPEFGPAPVTYTLSGGVIQINDPADGFMVARGGGSQGTFTFTSGSITNTVGDTHIGLDGVALWYQSGGNFEGAGVHIGRFASPYALAELSGDASWNVGLILLSDGFLGPATQSELKILGPNVTITATGLVMKNIADLTFDAQFAGFSTLHLNGNQLLLNNGELFILNPPVPSALNETIVLIDGISSYTGVDSQFDNAPHGTIFEAGTFDWQLQYSPSNIVLVSVPGCVAPIISLSPQDKQVIVNNSVTFNAGAGGTEPLYQWQFNEADISGANASSYNIPQVQFSDEGNYRVVVSNVCSGLSVTSTVAFLDVLDPHIAYTWDNGGGDNLYNNPNNWEPNGLPSVQDFAGNFIDSQLVINGDFAVDTLRLGAGGSVLHTNGTLRIVNGIFPDNGLWLEFLTNSYTLDGGTILIQDPNDGFMVGRAGDAVSTFNLLSGTVSNVVGDTHIGLDGLATWNQPGGNFIGAGVQIGRFANPGPVNTTLSGDAVWQVGLVLLADGHGVFTPRNPNPVNLTIVGPSVTYDSTGIVMMEEGNLTFDGTGGGISTMRLGGGIFLINNAELYVSNPPPPASLGQEIVLLSNIGAHLGPDTQFDNAPEGTVYTVPCGGAWTLDYRPDTGATNIVLVATALPAAVTINSITVSGGNATINFTAGASDSAGCFELWGAINVAGPYSNQGAAINSLGGGNFDTTVPVFVGSSGFYRIRRL